MTRRDALVEAFAPWAGLASGVVAAGLVHQFGSEGVFDHCATISPVPLLIAGIAGLAITLAGGVGSWTVLRDRSQAPARRIVATISTGAAALFALSILLPMIASLVIPRCFE